MNTPSDWLSPEWQSQRGRRPICEELIPLCRETPRTVAELVHLTDAKEADIRKAPNQNQWTVFKRIETAGKPDKWECRL